jgi:hypothetical protein
MTVVPVAEYHVIWAAVELVTVPLPPPAGVAHVPSPLRYVVELGEPVAEIPPTGSPVPLVRVIELGVPKFGVTSVGDVDRTTFPAPVLVVTPVPPWATDSAVVRPLKDVMSLLPPERAGIYPRAIATSKPASVTAPARVLNEVTTPDSAPAATDAGPFAELKPTGLMA